MHKQTRWLYEKMPNDTEIDSLASILGIDDALATLLLQRGISHFESAQRYFRPSLSHLHDPFIMQGMQKAVNRLLLAISQGEKILIYGDYDVDGVTAVALVYGFLRQRYDKLFFYIPDRHKEGYGLSAQAVQKAANAGITLIITLDCGIKALACVQQAKAAGIDVIICDHHEPGDLLPDAYAILDPKQKDCLYPCKALSGCGVGFKFLQAYLHQQGMDQAPLMPYLSLVAISIACDLVPIIGENRILAYHGLKQLNTAPSIGLQELMRRSHIIQEVTISQLVFGIGPRLNAAGRVKHGSIAVKLLLADSWPTAHQLADQLEASNRFRKELDSNITAEAVNMIEACESTKNAKTTVLFKKDWHKGVIGIVASRCIERYYRPTIILTEAGTKAAGSARSVLGFNIYEAISACADLLEQYGGHAYAAGLTLPLNNINLFKKRFEAVVNQMIIPEMLIPTQKIDLPLPFEKINKKFYHILRQMAPFGNGNMQPVFSSEPLVATSVTMVKETHLKLSIQQPCMNTSLEAIGFGLAPYAEMVAKKKPFKMAYTIELNHYQNAENLQLNIKALAPISS